MDTHRPPRILLNATDGPLSVRAVRRYVHALARGLASRPEEVELHLLFLTHHRAAVREFVDGLGENAVAKIHTIPMPRKWCDNRYRRPRFEMKRIAKQVDLYHETTVDHPALGVEMPYLMTVHGFATVVRPDICGAPFVAEKDKWFARALERSSHFVSVSETTRGEFLERFDFPADHVRAVPLGVDAHFTPGSREEAWRQVRGKLGVEFGEERDYLLYVGGVQANKNIPRVLETAQILRDRGVFDGPLILAGDQQYAAADWDALLDRYDARGRVLTTGLLAPEDPLLVALYRGASLFLFPTYYEGWTSPPLEAMACGTAVVASNASSVPETLGDAAELVDPDDAEAWAAAATRLLDDPERRKELRARGAARAAKYSWDRTVDHTIAFYRHALGLPGGAPPVDRVVETERERVPEL